MGKSIENGIGRFLVAAALISILAVAPTAGAAFTEDFNAIDYNVWEEFTSGNVNGKSLSTENGKLKIGFSADDFHPNIGYAGLRTKTKINVIPSTIEFTTELDNTNNPGSPYPEHAPVVVLSTEADPFPGASNSGQPASFQNALVFYKELSGNRGIVDTIIYKKDGAATILYSTGQMPHGTNPETKWKIDFQSSEDIKIYRDNSLIYESSTFNFPSSEVYLYAYMYSSASQWRYVLFDYIRITPESGAIVEEAHLLIGGNIGNVYGGEIPPEYAYLIGTYDYWGEIYVTFNYEDSTSETLSVSIPWDWQSPSDWTGTYTYRKYVGRNPARCSWCPQVTMFDAGFTNPNPTKKVVSIKVSDDWVGEYPWSDVFALTLKSPDVLTLPDWYSDGSGYYFLEKDDTRYFSTGAGANIFPEYSIYNGIKFYTHGNNDLPFYGGMDLSFDKAVKIDIEPTTYNFLGILPPIKADGSSIFNLGSTVPVKFRIADADENYVSTAVASITYQLVTDGVPGNVEVPVSTSVANEGNTFRYDSADNLYIFNLGTEGMDAGTYQLNINLDDGTTHTVRISLR